MDAPVPADVFLFEAFRFDRRAGALFRRDEGGALDPVAIGSRALAVLSILMARQGGLVSKDDIMQAVWPGMVVEENNLTVQISALRRVLDQGRADGSCIQTVPGRGYRFTAAVTRVAALSPDAVPPLPDKPSVAVMPFQNMSGDPEQEYFADGMVEEIITALSRIRWLFVIARNSTFTYKGQAIDVKRIGRELCVRYVLEGSVRKAGGRVRITAQLIEAETGAHLWADRFDGELEDVFDLQDEVASSVAGVIEPALHAAEIRRSAERPTHDLTAYDLYLRALPHCFSFEKERITLALGLIERAIERDPRYGPALALAAFCHVHLEVNGWADDPETNGRIGIGLAQRALQVAGDDPYVLGHVAFVLAHLGQDIDVSVSLVDRALVLNPNFAHGWYWSGILRNWSGQPDLALHHFQTFLRLSPLDRLPVYMTSIGAALFFQRRFEEAAIKLLESLQRAPNFAVTYRFLASCYAHMGRFGEAREIVSRLRAITPVVVEGATRYRNPEHRELFLSGLRLAASEAH
jgi:TolB-like protein